MRLRHLARGAVIALLIGGSALGATPKRAAGKAAATPAAPFQAGRPALKTRPVGDAQVIRTVIDAVGLIRGLGPRETTDTVNRLEWEGPGVLVDGGRTLKVTNYSYGLSLRQTAAREDVQAVDASGKPVRLVSVVAGQNAWDERTPGVGTAMRNNLAQERRLAFWRTPFGIAKALTKAAPGTVKVADPGPGAPPVRLEFPIEGTPTTVVLDAYYRPALVSQVVGGRKIEVRYSDYRDLAEYGLMFPTHVVETIDGKPHLEVRPKTALVASYLVFSVPPELSNSNG